jgi:hypothetical protein
MSDSHVMSGPHLVISHMAIMDRRWLRVYCRACGRQAAFWEALHHTRGCSFASRFPEILELTNATIFEDQPTVEVQL